MKSTRLSFFLVVLFALILVSSAGRAPHATFGIQNNKPKGIFFSLTIVSPYPPQGIFFSLTIVSPYPPQGIFFSLTISPSISSYTSDLIQILFDDQIPSTI
ncbi:hypothetical protein Ccrd_014242 [Cynara cardunculus var. scolymus]|uniref:Uncharacterized protein n=1 Tax=Cynara cardunculus var. scolymus TaxID=59895 RepID=A0A124SGU0_CYNCS|nr:hypothetical protein Ccrd_014242 [Cynara cardunculus var. scolymus]